MILIDENQLTVLINDAVDHAVTVALRRVSEKPLLTTAEVAETLSVSKRTVVGWRSRRLIPFVKLQGRVLYKREELMAFIEHREVRARETA